MPQSTALLCGVAPVRFAIPPERQCDRNIKTEKGPVVGGGGRGANVSLGGPGGLGGLSCRVTHINRCHAMQP